MVDSVIGRRLCPRIGALSSFVFLLGLGTAAAQPAVSGTSGTWANGQTVTVSGSSFGTKATAGPLVWEDFSDGTANNLSPHGIETAGNTNNLRHPFSSRNARADFKRSGEHGFYAFESGTHPKWFVQYWIKLASNWQWGTSTYGGGNDGNANIKFFRMFPTGSRNYTNVGYSQHGFNGGILRFSENAGDSYIQKSLDDYLTLGAWHNVQVEYGENSGVGAANGRMRLWIDGRLVDSVDNIVTNASNDGAYVNKRPYIIGFYDSWGPSDANVSNMYLYYSDIYVDNTFSRIEIGNAASYNQCTLREVQVPTAWSNGSVSLSVKQGQFTSGQQAYVYVVDSSGRVNAAGYPIQIGGSGGGGPTPTPPSAPTGVRITQ